MTSLLKTRWILCGGGLVALGMLLGRIASDDEGGALTILGESTLYASTASPGEDFAIATGPIDEDAEGVFVLEQATGELKCAVLSRRNRKFSALFQTNVTKELGPSKRAKYQMVTGMVDFNRASGASPGVSAVYVLNATNGKMAAYGIPWQREVSATGRPQLGPLKVIDGLNVRNGQFEQQ